ncbi:MAG: helix-turn-helix transcriptional regulator, partial [Oscillospiraceae bacterium]|nr:helix-turn-helix transcriptional regulator [Oscillospiraceae bacterium]
QELNRRLFLQKTGEIKRLPYNREKYADICSGNVEAAKHRAADLERIVNSRRLSDDPARNALFHMIIEASAVAAACIDGGMGHDEAYTLADIYISKADKCSTYEGQLELLGQMQLDFAERMREIRKESVISLHIRKCIDYIYENLKEDLTVNSLAEYCGLHPSYLSKLFYSETGIHMKRFVLEAKIDTAENLLKYTDLSCIDISSALGFSSQSSFICTFKKVTGTTPKKYRENSSVSEM